MEYTHVRHPFGPLYDKESEILILGSLPSVASRQQNFYYGHPSNRFWKVIASLFDEEIPKTIDEKKALLKRHHIALYDVIEECDIKGSSDSSIKNVIPTDLERIIRNSKVKMIFCNGKLSCDLYKKYHEKKTAIKACALPSTSPANAAYDMDKLMKYWKAIPGHIQHKEEK